MFKQPHFKNKMLQSALNDVFFNFSFTTKHNIFIPQKIILKTKIISIMASKAEITFGTKVANAEAIATHVKSFNGVCSTHRKHLNG